MLKAVATKPDGTKVLILGVDKGNVKRLRKGQPILVRGGEVGIGPVEIVIHYRETLRQLQADFEPMIGLDTKIHWDEGVEEILDGEPDEFDADKRLETDE